MGPRDALEVGQDGAGSNPVTPVVAASVRGNEQRAGDEPGGNGHPSIIAACGIRARRCGGGGAGWRAGREQSTRARTTRTT